MTPSGRSTGSPCGPEALRAEADQSKAVLAEGARP